MKIPKKGNTYLFVINDNIRLSETFLIYYRDKLKTIIKQKLNIDISPLLENDYMHVSNDIRLLEKFIHLNKLFDTRYTFKNCLKTKSIPFKRVLKPE